MEMKAATPAASAGRGKNGKKRQKTRSAAPDEPLPKPGCPPHCRFRLYYALFIDYAAAVVGATQETPNLEIAVAQSSHTAEDENENGGARVEVEEEEEGGMWGWAAEAGEELHRSGSYGKGTLSRSQPTFGRSRPPTAAARHQPVQAEGEDNRAKRERAGFHRKRDQPAARPHKRQRFEATETVPPDELAVGRVPAPPGDRGALQWPDAAEDRSRGQHRGWWDLSTTCPYLQMDEDERELLKLARTRHDVASADSDALLDEPAAVARMLRGAGFLGRSAEASDAQAAAATATEEEGAVMTMAETSSPLENGEFLQLGLEETFYLIAELRCLKVIRIDRAQPPQPSAQAWRFMGVDECWSAFCAAQGGFAYTYAAYRHYRQHNWVVKSGIKYGTDFVLYRRGPAHYHAEWSVVVQASGEGVVCGQWSAGGRQLSWRNLATLNRLSEQVAKGLLLCSVEPAGEGSSQGWATSAGWPVHQAVYRRWVPAVSRE
ncbi:tRNA intron endonuclease, catalytic Cterminal subfamily protein [Acanthamoeba castellanii str. Neff]|uniref:tRNA-intron lyase n=1 Tax=Acanthamoeba castellanii (strain ATCC 30010 / Neff) TaxID=1257118 RepID=L8GUV9_ACACF|nr:tRNA intron endonuclease, catalytic Cterminal subfamily protein [Acanthamoeba castellanii str. Neff]ELR15886.1 tRNA intron endonuclease, catalytic Cterminal subfamily protein [Acanthamoeba castellanii str. Neff]